MENPVPLSKRFAKIFDTEKSQLLVWIEHDKLSDVTYVHYQCRTKGTYSNLKTDFRGENRLAEAEHDFNSMTQEKAEEAVEGFYERATTIEGNGAEW